jgi:hypothetical protein
MDRDFGTLPIFLACMTFTLIIALTHVLGCSVSALRSSSS